jgi:hypothetical protein
LAFVPDQSVPQQQLKSEAILSFSTKNEETNKRIIKSQSLQINQARFIEITLKPIKK